MRSARVVRGLGYGLDEAALDAIKRFLFRPASVDGRPVQYTIPRYVFRFALQSWGTDWFNHGIERND